VERAQGAALHFMWFPHVDEALYFMTSQIVFEIGCNFQRSFENFNAVN